MLGFFDQKLGIFDRKLGFFDQKLGIFDQVGNLRPISWVFPTRSWESSSCKLGIFVLQVGNLRPERGLIY